MKKLLFRSAAITAGLIAPSAAYAQSPPTSCPPGSWFCAEPPDAQSAPAGSPVQPAPPVQPLSQLPNPDHGAAPAPPAAPSVPQAGSRPPPPPPPTQSGAPYGQPPPPPPLEYQLPPGADFGRPGAPPPYAYPYLSQYEPFVPPPPPLPFREWGINAHVAGAAIGRGLSGNTGMAGGGVGLRFKPTPRFGFEADVDLYGGTDYQGDARNETAFSVNALFYVNPRSRAQAYFVAGVGGSTAHVSCDPAAGCSGGAFDAQYNYFGGQVGVGFEFRLGRVVALNADVRGFVRTRTDSLAQHQPEFVSALGGSTNTSGGGLFTAGMTFYF